VKIRSRAHLLHFREKRQREKSRENEEERRISREREI